MEPLLIERPSEHDHDEHDWLGVSIVMIQNLPCRCTQEEIAAAVDELGFGAYVNYLHLPRKAPGGRNCGYGFIGFISPELTQKFRDVFEGYTLKSRASSKQLKLKPAHQQQARVNRSQSKPKPKQRNDIMGDNGLFLEEIWMQEQSEFLPDVPKKGPSATASTVQDEIALLAAVLKKQQSTLEIVCAQQMALSAELILKEQSTLQRARAQQIALSMFGHPAGLELDPAIAMDFGRTSIMRMSL
eukprot:TRINITY_DN4784_c0_g1_i4.p2 TRINITY_DN4784_c0_g1~~TRINITY_DN4784_c0_g1_i4.p2  ORF type:complete len:243 (+),score=51.74 TRINITY_DN4784_c0_g1_i4:86-814(+)